MKRFLLFVSILGLIIWSCQKPPKELILGQWKVEKIDVLNLDSLANVFYNLQKEDIQKRMENFKKILEDAQYSEDEKNLAAVNLEELQKELDSLSIDDIRKSILENTQKFVSINFNDDNTFVMYDNLGLETSGIWALDDKGYKLTLSQNNSRAEFLIEKITEDEMVWYYIENNGNIIIESKIYLKKQNAK